MEKSLEDLKLEADSLGVEYHKTIGAAKLQEKLDAYYDNESKASKVEEEKELTTTEKKTKATNSLAEARKIIAQQERENAKTEIVKITMVDRRESATATDVYLGNGDLGMKVPLDVFVEIPRILIRQAEDAKTIIHKEVDGVSTSSLVKKYVLEYKR
jgi:hypothetical protein